MKSWIVRRPLYISDYARAFERNGIGVRMVDRESLAWISEESDKPDFVLDSMTFGQHVQAVREAGVTFIAMNTDQWYQSPRRILPPFNPHLSGRMLVFCIGPEQVHAFRNAGYPHSEHMLFGIDAFRFRPLSAPVPDSVSFIGSPLRNHNPPSPIGRTDLPPEHPIRWVFDRCRPFRWDLPEVLAEAEKKFGPLFDGKADPDSPLRETWTILSGIGLAERDRLCAVDSLARNFKGFELWGSADWKDQLNDMGNITLSRYRGEADWATDLPDIISRTAVNVNVAKPMFRTGVCPRVFEIAACVRPILSNRIPAIEAIFPEDRAALYYDSPEELIDKARWLVENPTMADVIGSEARIIVEKDHQIDFRVRRILDALAAA